MDNTQPANHSARLEDLSSCYTSAPNFRTERETERAQTSHQLATKNQSLLLMPSGLKSMLKNTTETGDIGRFSIISPHPYAGTSSQWNSRGKSVAISNKYLLGKPIHEYHHINGHLGTDDRRRLPSYARDFMSDTASLCEPTSQSWMSRSHMGISEARCYSMTQASANSDLALGNRKSYTSLRSQLEIGQPQRPRSPFVYPKRLKRPGFRPSSPVLLSRGRVDYYRRAGIEKLPNVSETKTPSLSSLYANPKVPVALSIRSEFNRSIPSFVGTSSSPRRPSVSATAGTTDHVQHCTDRSDTHTRPSWPSPPGSSSSLASSAKFYSHGLLGSSTSTPVKRLQPSPLYYDYTEDFEVENTSIQNRATTENSLPPSFVIERTIHEDRELSTEWPSPTRNDIRDSNTHYNSWDHHVTCYSNTTDEQDASVGSMLGSETPNATPLSSLIRKNHSVKRCLDEEDNQFIKPALLNDLQEHRQPDTSQSSTVTLEDQPETLSRSRFLENHKNPEQDESVEMDCMSNRSSSYSLCAHLPKFPKPPDNVPVFKESSLSYRASVGHERLTNPPKDNFSNTKQAENTKIQKVISKKFLFMTGEKPESHFQDFSAESVSAEGGWSRSSQSNSIDHGQTDLTITIPEIERANFQIPNKDREFLESHVPQLQLDDSARGTTYYPSISKNQVTSNPHNPLPSSQRFENEGDLRLSNTNIEVGNHVAARESESASRNAYRHESADKSHITIPNFSHQIRIAPSQTNPSVLAPKPISPARELRLKQSIPLLMKALPPIPTRESVRALPPPLTPSVAELPFRFAPLMSDVQHTAWPAVEEGIENGAPDLNLSWREVSSHTSVDWITPFQPLPTKFKLKSKSIALIGPLSLPSSFPWDVSENHPFTDQLPDMQQRSSAGDQLTTIRKSQKFKLRVTKTSSSSFGTVRVNKAARNRVVVHGLDPHHPKDLFTSSTGLTDIFRQVSTHFVPRKKSGSGESMLPTKPNNSVPKNTPDNMQRSRQVSSVLFAPQTAQPGLFAKTPTEVRSFFSDDSSQMEDNRGLRKRFSDLRARIPVPYGIRPQEEQSLDGPTIKRGIGGFVPARRRSRLNTMVPNRDGCNFQRGRPHKLKKKVLCWLRDAQTAVKGYAKSRRHENELFSH